MAKILLVGTNDAILTTRGAILERAGHQVTLASDTREVMAGCEQGSFDVVVLGQSLPPPEKHRVTDSVHKLCPGVKILEYHNGVAPDVPTADAHLHVASTSPESLVTTVKALARLKR